MRATPVVNQSNVAASLLGFSGNHIKRTSVPDGDLQAASGYIL